MVSLAVLCLFVVVVGLANVPDLLEAQDRCKHEQNSKGSRSQVSPSRSYLSSTSESRSREATNTSLMIKPEARHDEHDREDHAQECSNKQSKGFGLHGNNRNGNVPDQNVVHVFSFESYISQVIFAYKSDFVKSTLAFTNIFDIRKELNEE
ncbi:hypothetical protein BCEN4_740160 [Burkholderia cenocepacia]|nr:hypothetical protein BCEN4_740160 [Burkholderia cenocepacia]